MGEKKGESEKSWTEGARESDTPRGEERETDQLVCRVD